MWHIRQSPAPLPASGYQSWKVMTYLVVGKCGTSGNPLHRCLLQVISPEWLWLTWMLVNVAHPAIPCTAACFRLSVLKVMAYLVVGKCGTSGNPLHCCLLQVISPEGLWLTWLLENVAHLAIPCTAACFRLSVLKVMTYLVVGKCGTSGNPLHCCLLQVIRCTAACFRLSVQKVMAYLVVGKCGTSGNPLHCCLLQVQTLVVYKIHQNFSMFGCEPHTRVLY